MHVRVRGLIALGAAVAFVLVAIDVHFGGPFSHLDVRTAREVTPLEAGILTSTSEFLATMGSWQVATTILLASTAILSVWQRQVDPLITASAALLLLGGSGLLLKAGFGRSGPGGPHPGDMWFGAFPSGHAAAAVVVSGVLAYLVHVARPSLPLSALWGAAVIWSGLVGWSRVHLNVHWVSDVIAGWALGIVVVCCVSALHERLVVARRAPS